MEINNIVEKTYKPIFLELEEANIFRNEKQKEKWWSLVKSGLNYTNLSINTFLTSNVITGVEILANACCDNCKKHDGVVYKDVNLIPYIPIVECLRMKEGLNCNCCFLNYID